MPLTSTVLTTSPSSIYTSTGNNAVTTMYICNTSDVAVEFNIHAVPSGSSPSNSNIIYYQVPLQSRDTYVIDSEKLILGTGDALHSSIVDPALTGDIGLSTSGWGTNNINSVFWSQDLNQYIVAGDSGKIAVSETGERWQYIPGLINAGWSSNLAINDITRINYKRYVAVGPDGAYGSSTDGVDWNYTNAISSTAWGSGDINAIANNGSIYVAVGEGGRVATSLNGVTWQFQSNLSQTGWGISTVWSILWDGDKFIAGGDGGKIASSVDGISWTYTSSLANNLSWGVNTRVTGIAYSGSPTTGYLAVTRDSNRAATSLDGINWTYNNGLASVGDVASPGSASVTFRSGYGFYVLGLVPKVYLLDISGTWSEIDNDLVSQPWGSYHGTDILWNTQRAEFIATGANARVATSSDSIMWTYRTDSANANITLPNVVVTVSSIRI